MAILKQSFQLLKNASINHAPAITVTKNKSTQQQLQNDCDSEKFIALEKRHAAGIYDPMPVVISRGKGVKLWDVNEKEYLDFMAGYAAVNTGHAHPKIIETLKKQAGTLFLTSRAIYNTELPLFSEYVTKMFNYDKVIPMNTGVEGADTAIKMARRWGYLTKGIPENQAIVIMVTGNFWGRSLSAISTSEKPIMYEYYGPYMPGFRLIPFNNISALEEALNNPNVCAFMAEPILGEGGVVVPCDKYLARVRELCTERNVLWIADEIQTGLGRTGALLAVDHEQVRPDILILGKGLAGGMLPISAVLANDEIMCHMKIGSHGSTFGGNPLASRVAMKTLDVIKEESLVENSRKMGEKLRADLMCKLPSDMVTQIRGKGLMNALVINPHYAKAAEVVNKMRASGLLAKATDDKTIRLTPPLTINEAEMNQAIDIITESVHECKQ